MLIVPVIASCNNHEPSAKPSKQDTNINSTANIIAPKEPLAGTWIYHDSKSFRMIEIIDSTHVFFTGYTDQKEYAHRDADNRYWYYKSKAVMGYRNQHSIWIGTDRFRFDYNISGDTLIEYDKMGEQGKFIRVYTSDEKADR